MAHSTRASRDKTMSVVRENVDDSGTVENTNVGRGNGLLTTTGLIIAENSEGANVVRLSDVTSHTHGFRQLNLTGTST